MGRGGGVGRIGLSSLGGLIGRERPLLLCGEEEEYIDELDGSICSPGSSVHVIEMPHLKLGANRIRRACIKPWTATAYNTSN